MADLPPIGVMAAWEWVQSFLASMTLLVYGCLQVSLWFTQWAFGEDFWEIVDRG